jgi:hypothetical protein
MDAIHRLKFAYGKGDRQWDARIMTDLHVIHISKRWPDLLTGHGEKVLVLTMCRYHHAMVADGAGSPKMGLECSIL